MITQFTWTEPYYGLSHFGEFGTKNRWATVEVWDSFVILKKWFPGCGFSPEESIHYSIEKAKKLGEKFVLRP